MCINTFWTIETHEVGEGQAENTNIRVPVHLNSSLFIIFFWRAGGGGELIWNSSIRTAVIYSTWWKMSKAASRQVPFFFWHRWLHCCIHLTRHVSASHMLAHWSIFPALSRSGCPFAVVNEVAVLASTPHLFSAANNAQTAAELPCPTIYKLHSGRIDPGGQLTRVWKERDL